MTPQKYLSKVRYQIQYQYQIKLEMSNRNIKLSSLRALKTFKGKRAGQTVQFRIIISLQ